MNEIKLNPCPFCGGEAVLYHQSSKYTDHDGDYAYCMNCGCRTKLFECYNGTGKTHSDTEREAMLAWNRRAYNEQREAMWVDNHCTACGMSPIGEETWTEQGQTPPKFEYFMSFCPCCGAKMKGSAE